MKTPLFVFLIFLFLQSCTPHFGDFSSTSMPSFPDYSRLVNWAAHPHKNDPSDRVPKGLESRQGEALVDVFFLHPTSLTKKPRQWNAQIGDAKINQKTDETSILFQASIFNNVGRVYAPRYRQAHLQSFFTEDKENAEKALELAYTDIKAAFEHYLENENQKRPIVLVGHSQGALHGKRLLHEFFDQKPLRRRLVVAYLAGWPVNKGEYMKVPPCETPEQTGCVCSWRTFKRGHVPKGYSMGDSILVTNPISWKTDTQQATKDESDGAVLRDFDEVLRQIMDAQVHQSILWANKPKFPGSIFFLRRNYHVGDFNLFYLDVRENVKTRVGAFWK